MSTYKETTIAGKAAKRGITDQREQPQKSKKAKPVVVECRRAQNLERATWLGKDWKKWGAYRSKAEADMAIAALRRKWVYLEFRIQP